MQWREDPYSDPQQPPCYSQVKALHHQNHHDEVPVHDASSPLMAQLHIWLEENHWGNRR